MSEHLWFYSRMKGMQEAQVQQEMKRMVQEIGLPHKAHALAKTLSGNWPSQTSVHTSTQGSDTLGNPGKPGILGLTLKIAENLTEHGIWGLALELMLGADPENL